MWALAAQGVGIDLSDARIEHDEWAQTTKPSASNAFVRDPLTPHHSMGELHGRQRLPQLPLVLWTARETQDRRARAKSTVLFSLIK
jgi:hypothetical protein